MMEEQQQLTAAADGAPVRLEDLRRGARYRFTWRDREGLHVATATYGDTATVSGPRGGRARPHVRLFVVHVDGEETYRRAYRVAVGELVEIATAPADPAPIAGMAELVTEAAARQAVCATVDSGAVGDLVEHQDGAYVFGYVPYGDAGDQVLATARVRVTPLDAVHVRVDLVVNGWSEPVQLASCAEVPTGVR